MARAEPQLGPRPPGCWGSSHCCWCHWGVMAQTYHCWDRLTIFKINKAKREATGSAGWGCNRSGLC